MAAVSKDDKWGFIDKTGSFVIKAKFDGAGDFAEGLAPVKADSKWGYVDKSGQIVIEPQFGLAQSFRGGIARAADSSYDPADPDINVIGHFECITVWRPGKKVRWGYIDKSGKYVWLPSR
ncbi:MAG: WG repeat-containing protein [Acidobacteria bacterium]|nr:WG repeat-containing protein [Acidobacteriota bacterium]